MATRAGAVLQSRHLRLRRIEEIHVTRVTGFDPARLARLDKHFARYVDDGRLPGWQLALTQGGDVVHESTYGWRDREAGTPVETDTIWRIASMTKPITAVAAMTLWGGGVVQATPPVTTPPPGVAHPR